jgi:acyl-CoA synthetase (AMP-forming)/AMP-acid ligase II
MIGRRNQDIANIAVVGIPDERKGQIPKAYVQLSPGSGATALEIEGWFKKHISAYKVPKVEIITEFPMTPKGSIDMKRLLEERSI